MRPSFPFLCSDFELGEKLRVQQELDSAQSLGESKAASNAPDWLQLQVGSLAKCKVSDHAHYGIVMDMDVHEVRGWALIERMISGTMCLVSCLVSMKYSTKVH